MAAWCTRSRRNPRGGEHPVQLEAGHQRQRGDKQQRLHGGKAFDAVGFPRGGVNRVPIGEQQ